MRLRPDSKSASSAASEPAPTGKQSVSLEPTTGASTSSVDKSVHKEVFTACLGCSKATAYQIAYFVGIEEGHVATTIYRAAYFCRQAKTTISDLMRAHQCFPLGRTT